MVKSVLMLAVLLLVNQTYGNPTSSAVSDDDSLVVAKPRGTEWISLQSSWKLPSLPSISSLFGNSAPENAELEIIKKRINSLEVMQIHIIKFIRKNCKGGNEFWTIGDEDSETEQPIIPTNNENSGSEKPEVWPTTSQTSTSTTIDQSAAVETNSRISSTQPELSVLASSENPITSFPAKPIEQPTTQNSNKGDSENTNVNSQTDYHAPTISQLENLKLGEENNSTEISSSFRSLDGFAQRQENGRINGKLPWNKDKKN